MYSANSLHANIYNRANGIDKGKFAFGLEYLILHDERELSGLYRVLSASWMVLKPLWFILILELHRLFSPSFNSRHSCCPPSSWANWSCFPVPVPLGLGSPPIRNRRSGQVCLSGLMGAACVGETSNVLPVFFPATPPPPFLAQKATGSVIASKMHTPYAAVHR